MPYKHSYTKYGFALAAQLNAGTILPEGIVIITLLVVLVADLIVGRSSSRWVPYVALAGLLGSLIALYFQRDVTNPVSFLLIVTPSVLCCVASLPCCCRDDFDVDSLYRAERHGFG